MNSVVERESFLEFISALREGLLHTDSLEEKFTVEDCRQILDSLKRIAAAVLHEIQQVFPNQQMPDAECAAVLDLMAIQDRLRAEANLRLEAIKQFDAMTATSVS